MHITLISWVGLFILSFLVALYATISGGGALVLVPVFSLIGIPLLPAIASVRVVSFFLQLIGVVAFQRKKKVDWKISLWSSLWVIPTSILGASIALYLSQRVLTILVAVLMLFALTVFLRINIKNSKEKPQYRYYYLFLAIGCLLLGLYGGIYGAAFSTLLMIFYMYLGGKDLLESSANASVVGLVMAFAASLVYVRSGVINWAFILPLVIGGGIGTVLAVEIASKKSPDWIKGLLIVIIVLSVLKLIATIL